MNSASSSNVPWFSKLLAKCLIIAIANNGLKVKRHRSLPHFETTHQQQVNVWITINSIEKKLRKLTDMSVIGVVLIIFIAIGKTT